ncbi:hypothetical protein CYLTODRAFT_400938 [Cylindrobasidium torrendii FP15055 ss-10]|uniref:Wax synthase domain-containing protein n=1 Tax=Cylindrobasidium torrendii FP15055 ss-10 TaxID=1314674 RepID=A0A0D7B3E6_9AGAR|nr:hypothetical protein CYLTODRAFT_400938 [Cylindrobasidium torrendii FP15055 ss-10]
MTCQKGWFRSSTEPVQLTGTTFYTHFLPPVTLYYVQAILVTLPNTILARLALLPVGIFFSYRAAVHLNLSGGDTRMESKNAGITVLMGILTLRIFGWSFERAHLVRVGKQRNRARTTAEVLLDAAELCFNQRGIGWNWGRPPTNAYGPDLSRYTSSLQAAASFIKHAFVFEIAVYIHDAVFKSDNLLPQAARSIIAVLIFPLMTYAHGAAHYDMLHFFGVAILGQEGKEWPPLFNKPWRSTSLADFWGRRWQQHMRDSIARAGGHPLDALFGAPGYVLGTFLASGIWHDLGIWGASRSSGLCCTLTPFFVLNGIGVVAEGFVRRASGRRPGGVAGWIWTMGWLLTTYTCTFNFYCMQSYYHGAAQMQHLQLYKALGRVFR